MPKKNKENWELRRTSLYRYISLVVRYERDINSREEKSIKKSVRSGNKN
jgi:hypothetical protein